MNPGRLLAVWHARNLEFLRDRSTLIFNFLFPLALVVAFAVIFGGQPRALFKVDVLAPPGAAFDASLHPFLGTRYVDFVRIGPDALAETIRKVERHQVDLLLDLRDAPRYWINEDSPKGYLAEKLLLESVPVGATREPVSGTAVRYVDWLLPGILGMNMMFSCLFGVGYVVVRYRKSGFLRRLSATPVTAFEFGAAQVLSRLLLTVSVSVLLYGALALFVPFRNEGSALLLLLVAVAGALAMISFGFMMAARFASEELANGAINLASWPMMLLSGVWFSLEGAPSWLQSAAKALPLTQMLDAARAVMLDGAGFQQVLPHVGWLAAMTLLFLGIAAAGFRWRPD
ncbi:MAG TPA: ABC transporter permease [Steroidobacteraceae bacterium]|nr:ABC transporter permease [Steroidobacteraceae bacterium]